MRPASGRDSSCDDNARGIRIADGPKFYGEQVRSEGAKAGKVLEAVIAGAGQDGTPACASVPLAKVWRVV